MFEYKMESKTCGNNAAELKKEFLDERKNQLRLCRDCIESKTLNLFPIRVRRSGTIYVGLSCLSCNCERQRKGYYANRDARLKTVKAYNNRNKRRKKLYLAEYYKLNKDHMLERRRNNVELKLAHNLRERVRSLLVGKSKSARTIKLIGCDIPDFMKWVQSQFDSQMTWENYGAYWEIDHVIPCDFFDLKVGDEQYKCFHWSNCRPLERSKNRAKSNKILPFEILMQELRYQTYSS